MSILSRVAAAPPQWATALPVANRWSWARATAAQTQASRGRSTQETDPGAAAHAAPAAMLSYPRLAFGLRAQKVGDTWNATVSNLNMARPTAAWLAARIEAQWMRTADGRTKASGKTDRVVLDALWPLLAYLPESEAAARLRALECDRHAQRSLVRVRTRQRRQRAEVFAADSRRARALSRLCSARRAPRLERRSADDARGRRAEARFARCSVRAAADVSRAARRAGSGGNGALAQRRARHGRSSPATFA